MGGVLESPIDQHGLLGWLQNANSTIIITCEQSYHFQPLQAKQKVTDAVEFLSPIVNHS
jgi:hypothetical protein